MTLNLRNPIARYVLIGLVILAVVAAGWFLIGRLFPPNPAGPTESERRSDSLAITKPIDQALIDSSNARIAARGPASARAEAAASAAQASANRNRQIADSLALVAAQAADSTKAWHAAYDARNSEAIDLRSTVASDAITISSLKADTTDLRSQLGIVNKRLLTTEDVNRGLRKDLAQARTCKIIGLIQCPSRIQTAALTLVTYVVVDRVRRR